MRQIQITFQNLKPGERKKVQFYCLNAEHDMELVREEVFTAETFSVFLKMRLFDTYYIQI